MDGAPEPNAKRIRLKSTTHNLVTQFNSNRNADENATHTEMKENSNSESINRSNGLKAFTSIILMEEQVEQEEGSQQPPPQEDRSSASTPSSSQPGVSKTSPVVVGNGHSIVVDGNNYTQTTKNNNNHRQEEEQQRPSSPNNTNKSTTTTVPPPATTNTTVISNSTITTTVASNKDIDSPSLLQDEHNASDILEQLRHSTPSFRAGLSLKVSSGSVPTLPQSGGESGPTGSSFFATNLPSTATLHASLGHVSQYSMGTFSNSAPPNNNGTTEVSSSLMLDDSNNNNTSYEALRMANIHLKHELEKKDALIQDLTRKMTEGIELIKLQQEQIKALQEGKVLPSSETSSTSALATKVQANISSSLAVLSNSTTVASPPSSGNGGPSSYFKLNPFASLISEPESHLELKVVQHPPSQAVYQRILRPFPTVAVKGVSKLPACNNLFVEVSLLKQDDNFNITPVGNTNSASLSSSSNSIQNVVGGKNGGNPLEGEKKTLIGGQLVQRSELGTGTPDTLIVVFRKLKILTTTAQQGGAFFLLKFVLKRYVENSFEVVPGVNPAISDPIEVFSHTLYLKSRPATSPTDPSFGVHRISTKRSRGSNDPLRTSGQGVVSLHNSGNSIPHTPSSSMMDNANYQPPLEAGTPNSNNTGNTAEASSASLNVTANLPIKEEPASLVRSTSPTNQSPGSSGSKVTSLINVIKTDNGYLLRTNSSNLSVSIPIKDLGSGPSTPTNNPSTPPSSLKGTEVHHSQEAANSNNTNTNSPPNNNNNHSPNTNTNTNGSPNTKETLSG